MYREINNDALFVNCVGEFGISPGKGMGSGTIINQDGTILTCAHAVVDFHGLRASSKGKVRNYIPILII